MNLAVDESILLVGASTAWLAPLWIVAVVAIGASIALVLAFLLGRLVVPKVAAIAQVTTKEALSQPLFWLLLVFGAILLFVFLYLPYNTFGEDIKMLKAEGLTLIKILAVIMAVWTASVSIADELEGRTALTLLSKPIGRHEMILGKFLGVIIPVAIIFIVLGALFLTSVSYKVVYDARESSEADPTAETCTAEMVQVLPGLGLAFMEAVVLASVAVAISTRLPILANLTVCATIYTLGHLAPVLVQSTEGQIGWVSFVGGLSSAVFPVLGHFNVETALFTGERIPWSYLGWAGVYAAVYCAAAMLLALLLFEDRDLA